MNITRSMGQGNFHSELSRRISSNGTSIIKRLASCPLTGQNLKIKIRQHIGFEVHLVWQVHDRDRKSLGCMERIFSLWCDLHKFLNEIRNGGLECLCDCVITHVLECFKVKVDQCHMETNIQTQIKRLHTPRSWERSLREINLKTNYFLCLCPISSSYTVGFQRI
jgi:hypothetical protein